MSTSLRDFMNAAGWAKTTTQVALLANVPTIDHVVAGSFTVLPRDGNNGGTNFAVTADGTSVNSLGLPNGGVPYLQQHGREMARIAHDAGKHLVLSVAGFSPEEYGTLAAAAYECGADIVELNVGCPNVHDGGYQKEIVSYNFDLLRATLMCVRTAAGGKPLWLKLSPYANPADRVRAVAALDEYGEDVDALVVANTFPNISLYDGDGKPLLTVADNYGGMAGESLRAINLSQCRHYSELLKGRCEIIGVGGISRGAHMRDYEDIGGCAGWQVGTAFFHNEDCHVFGSLVEEYAALQEPLA